MSSATTSTATRIDAAQRLRGFYQFCEEVLSQFLRDTSNHWHKAPIQRLACCVTIGV
jgi:hypothetical protein